MTAFSDETGRERGFVSGCCEGEKCHCGADASHKVEETIFHDDPIPHRHPLTTYLCHAHFVQAMGPAAKYPGEVVALSASPVAQEPVAYMWDELIDPTGDVIVGKTVTRFATHWSTPPANAVVTKLYPSPPATSAGVGADEIARVFARWKKSKNLHESLAAQSIEKELLALLSRGSGDQSHSTHEA